ncbi:methyl-accepting chemotaxis protein [Geomonas subterranea]|uniref:methyl-accepting chemotaxis protein n=1 Tax=Geomonas subterranea TaxID=2847989 RepID=UPI001CD3C5B2|nr:cache domain-containing protein [Geomonas fuzhouensis]
MKISIVKKITALIITLVITAVSITTYISLAKMRQEMVRVATASQESRLNTFWELLKQKGEPRIAGDRLMAGDYVINDNNELPDKVARICGGTATIFMNDTRVATNVVKEDGSRAVGTKLQGPAFDAVFRKGEPYRGVAPILNIPYFTAYDPILDAGGHVIGALYVGVKAADFLQSFEHTRSVVISLAIGFTILASCLAAWFTKMLLAPLGKAVAITEAVAEGDLTVAIPAGGGDEAGKLLGSLKTMVSGLCGMISRVAGSATALQDISGRLAAEAVHAVAAARHQQDKVTDTSSYVRTIADKAEEIQTGTQRLAQAASESSSAILEMTASTDEVAINAERLTGLVAEVTAAMMQSAAATGEIGEHTKSLVASSLSTASSILEMEAATNSVKGNALLTAEVAQGVEEDALKGVEAMRAMRQGMSDIRASSGVTNQVITTLTSRTHEIGAISSVIDDIAKRTSLLALNASIIAAQAGTHGKAFGVVAEEIKMLASSTANSTNEIAALIAAVQLETEHAVKAIKEADQRIATGEELSSRSSAALEKIVTGVSSARSHVSGIALATAEQAKGTSLIREAMDRVTQMTEKIERAIREQSGAKEAIMFAAAEMTELATQFRSATMEQSKVGRAISDSILDVSEMSRKIETACAVQAKESLQIAAAVTEIHSDADRCLQAAAQLEAGASDLTSQVEVLQQGAGAFRL